MSELTTQQIHQRNTIEAALMASRQPLTIRQMKRLLHDDSDDSPDREQLLALLHGMQEEYANRGLELVELASGWQLQVGSRYSDKLLRLWQEKPPRLSRALLETLAIIAYRQPVTRGEIEEIRGIQISRSTTQTLFERNWICVVGHRDVPGRPELLATTKKFLDYFQLRRLEDLPPARIIGNQDDMDTDIDLFTNATEGDKEETKMDDIGATPEPADTGSEYEQQSTSENNPQSAP